MANKKRLCKFLTRGAPDSIHRIQRDTGKVVEVVSTWGNQKAISGGMGRVFRLFKQYYLGPLRSGSHLVQQIGNQYQANDQVDGFGCSNDSCC